MQRVDITLRNRDLYGALAGLNIIGTAKRGKCDLYGTFKFHLSTARGAVARALDTLNEARRALRDEHAKKDGRGQIVTAQLSEGDPNSAVAVLQDPVAFETAEREMLDTDVTLSVPLLRYKDVLALDFSDVQGDYAGALAFIEPEDEPAPSPVRAEA